MKNKGIICLVLSGVLLASGILQGCQHKEGSTGKTEIEILQYKS